MKKQVIILALILLLPQGIFAKSANDPFAEQWAYREIGLYDAWNVTTGSKNVVVAIIDNGFDTFHPDLIDNVWKNKNEIANNNIDDDNNGYVDDINGWNFVPTDTNGDGRISARETFGNNNPRPQVDNLSSEQIKEGVIHHATIIASLIGGKSNNGLGGAGINWNVSLMNLKVVGNDGIGTIGYLDDAIRYAVDNGADVINISMVGTQKIDNLDAAVDYAYSKGVLIVAAAGNNRFDLNTSEIYPACSDAGQPYEKIIGVSAIEQGKHFASFSNFGKRCVDITAPGVSIGGAARYSPKNGLDKLFISGYQGTSFSSPLVAGAAALIKSIQPTWGAPELMRALFDNTHITPGQDPSIYEDFFGAGLLQIDKAVQYAKTGIRVRQSNQTVQGTIPQVKNTAPEASDADIFGPGYIAPVATTDAVSIDIETGNVISYKENGIVQIKNILAFKGASAIESFILEGNRAYVVITKNVGNGSSVSILNKEYVPLYTWESPFNHDVDIAVGDLIGMDTPEIILAPKTGSLTGYIVYNIQGDELFEKVLPTKHSGVSVQVAQHTVFMAHSVNNQAVVVSYDKTGKELGVITSSFIRNVGDVRIGNFDADSDLEVVIAAGEGEQPWLGVYELSGDLKRRFWGINPDHRGGIEVLAYDKNNDGIDDIVVTPLGEVSYIKMVSTKVKSLGQWNFAQKIKRIFTVIQ